MTKKGSWIAATAFGFLSAATAPQAMAQDKDGGEQVVCEGINACKGQGSCGGPGHACAGQNACKGQGQTRTTKKECEAKGGKIAAPMDEKKDDKKKGDQKKGDQKG
jgi:hypothetical protein